MNKWTYVQRVTKSLKLGGLVLTVAVAGCQATVDKTNDSDPSRSFEAEAFGIDMAGLMTTEDAERAFTIATNHSG